MKRVTGIGGVFFKSKNVAAIKDWYRDNLGFGTTQWGASMRWGDIETNSEHGHTEWSPFKEDTDHYAPSTLPFMINYRVHDLRNLIEVLRDEGVKVVGGIDEYEYGKFAWIMDPEGRKLELWEPVDGGFGEPSPIWKEKVTGLAGIYFKSDNPGIIRQWYKIHLAINGDFHQRDLSSNKEVSVSWTPLDDNDNLFAETEKPYVFSYRVRDLRNVIEDLKRKNFQTALDNRSGWVIDPEGNKAVLRES